MRIVSKCYGAIWIDRLYRCEPKFFLIDQNFFREGNCNFAALKDIVANDEAKSVVDLRTHFEVIRNDLDIVKCARSGLEREAILVDVEDYAFLIIHG